MSPRTINREFLGDQWGTPLEFHRSKGGWYYTKPYPFPFPRLSQGEALALLFGFNLLAQCRGTGLEEAVEAVLAKLPSVLPQEVSLDAGSLLPEGWCGNIGRLCRRWRLSWHCKRLE